MALAIAPILSWTLGCAGPAKTPRHVGSMATNPDDARLLSLQSVVMSMADDWNIALGESFQNLQSSSAIDLRARIEALWFLRNGMGASLDIAVGPNPRVAMLDLLVLATLQTWALEHTWAGNGIPGNLSRPGQGTAGRGSWRDDEPPAEQCSRRGLPGVRHRRD